MIECDANDFMNRNVLRTLAINCREDFSKHCAS